MNLNQIVFDPIISYHGPWHGEMILYLKMYPFFFENDDTHVPNKDIAHFKCFFDI